MCGVGSEIAAVIMEEAFDYLDAPMERIVGADVPMPYSVSIEQLAIPQVFNIVNAILKVTNTKKK